MKTPVCNRPSAAALGAALLLTLVGMPVVAQDVRSDAVLRVTFAGNSPDDITAGDVSAATVVSNITYTTDLPAMANGSGHGAVFNGTNAFLSYGLGAANELKVQCALTYHARVRYSTNGFVAGRGEQWVMGRFRESATLTSTRVAAISTSPVNAGGTNVSPFVGASADGLNWSGGAGLLSAFAGGGSAGPASAIIPGFASLVPGVFYDLYLRYDGANVFFDVFNAETGGRAAGPFVMAGTMAQLADVNSPFDVGDRYFLRNAPLNGVIEQLNVWSRALADDEIQALSSDPGFQAIGLIRDLQPTNGAAFLPAGTVLRFTAQSAAGVGASGLQLLVNGVDRSSELTVTGEPSHRQVTFAGLTVNTDYQVEIKVQDQGGHSKRQVLAFNTFSSGLRLVEAEDYDFESGQFLDNPVLASYPAADNYLDRQSVGEVDRHLVRTNSNPYRIGDPVGVGFANDFPLRQAFAEAQAMDPGVADYALTALQDGDWLNYTRTLSPDRYRVYARVRQTWSASYRAGLSRVDGGTLPLGAFAGGVGTGGWTTVPVGDPFGAKPLVLKLGDRQTLRFSPTLGSSGVQVNYLLLVPATASEAALAYVNSFQPADGQTGVKTNAPVVATILNQSTQVDPASLRLRINGQDVTSAASLTPTADGLSVSYLPASGWPQLTTQAVALTFQDNGSPVNSTSNFWQFVVVYVPGGDTPEVFADAVLRVTFSGNNPNDQTTNASAVVAANNLTYTTDLPPLANSSGHGAVFNGTDSWLSYGLGAANVLKLQTNLTYHVRVKYTSWKANAEQFLAGRFRSTDQGTSTRVSFMTALAGSTFQLTGAASGDGNAWAGAASSALSVGVFYDVFMRYSPGVIKLDVFNAETGARVGSAAQTTTTFTSLKDANSAFDVGNRTTPQNVPLAGVVQQVNVWARALADAEISRITYGPGAPGPSTVRIESLRQAEGGQWVLTFMNSQASAVYAVQQTSSLAEPSWTDVEGAVFTPAGAGTTSARFAVPEAAARYYRVRLK